MSSQQCPGGLPMARFALSLSWDDLAFVRANMKNEDQKLIEEFETAFAKRLGLCRAFFISSARVGMFKALEALNMPQRSLVLMPAWTHPSMPVMVEASKHRVRIADVDAGTFTLTPQSIKPKDWEGVNTLVLTHMYGCPAPAKALEQEARQRGITVLEDCAQGLGAMCEDRPAGATGVCSFYSFALTKNFTTLSGGMLGVRDPHLAEKLEVPMRAALASENSSILPVLVKAYAMKTAVTKPGFTCGVYPPLALGWAFSGRDMLHPAFEEKFSVMPPGQLKRPAPVQAALGLRKLHDLDEHNRRRHENGVALLEMLKAENIPDLTLPELPPFGTHIFMSFVVRHPHRDRLARLLFSKRIDTSPGYLMPVNQVDCLRGVVTHASPLPNAERLGTDQLHLPIYPELTRADLQRLAKTVAWASAKAMEESPEV